MNGDLQGEHNLIMKRTLMKILMGRRSGKKSINGSWNDRSNVSPQMAMCAERQRSDQCIVTIISQEIFTTSMTCNPCNYHSKSSRFSTILNTYFRYHNFNQTEY